MPETRETCPTCGCLVTVATGNEGTSHYETVDPAHIRSQLLTELAEEFERKAKGRHDEAAGVIEGEKSISPEALGAAQALDDAADHCRHLAAQLQIDPNPSEDLELAAKEESE